MSGTPSAYNDNASVLFRFASKDPAQSQDMSQVSAVEDYSDSGLGSIDFCIQPEEDEMFAVYRLLGSIKDQGSFDSGSYGNGIALTNGITLKITENGFTIFLTPLPIITITDWGRYCYDVDPLNFGSGAEYANFRWTFTKGGGPLWLDGRKDQKLCLTFNDDFSGLIEHVFLFQGRKYPVDAI